MTKSRITPPPKLVQQWGHDAELSRTPYSPAHWAYEQHIATRAVQWGADQELEACCEWMLSKGAWYDADAADCLRRDRRPKPPSLKQQALDLLKTDLEPGQKVASITLPAKSIDTIRRALEALSDE